MLAGRGLDVGLVMISTLIVSWHLLTEIDQLAVSRSEIN